jgi:hypothetical protein
MLDPEACANYFSAEAAGNNCETVCVPEDAAGGRQVGLPTLRQCAMPLPADQLPIGEGRDPSGQPGAMFYVDRAELDIIEQDGPDWKLDDARFIAEAVAEPDAIFEGLQRPGQEKSLCYAVRPTHDPDQESESLPRYGFVFLVFVRLGVGGFVVFDWEWREEDPDMPGYPVGWKDDFARRTWQKT